MTTEDDKTPQAEPFPASGDPSAADAALERIPERIAGVVAEGTPDNPDAAIVQCANLFLNVRHLLLMSLGALALTADEARDFVERLGARGDLPQEVAQEEVERWVDDLHHQHPDLPVEAIRNGADGHSDALWGRLRVPTRRELEALSRKIGELDQRLAALRAKRSPGPPADDPASSPPSGVPS